MAFYIRFAKREVSMEKVRGRRMSQGRNASSEKGFKESKLLLSGAPSHIRKTKKGDLSDQAGSG